MEYKVEMLLQEAINDIFLRLGAEELVDGDIGFDAEYDINRLTEKLAGVMAGAIEELKNRD